ncbi:MAG: thermonuclease family protein [Methylococcaceae bacterium]|nr:thermonuclease family protein [Methylococcaceae bacterium]
MRFLTTLFLLLTLSPLLNAETFKSKVVDITDGDTFTVVVDNQTIKIRMYGIDAPEIGQPFGQRAKDGLF